MVTPPGSESGPDRNALLLPLAASTTALPEPAQPLSADCSRDVSGGDCSAELLNCSLLVASCAFSVVQVAGIDGLLTWRLSPVASVTPGGKAADVRVEPMALEAAGGTA